MPEKATIERAGRRRAKQPGCVVQHLPLLPVDNSPVAKVMTFATDRSVESL